MEDARLIISLEPNGQVTVNGPIANKLLCYGLLEAAKDAIKEWKPAETNRIVVPQFVPPANGGHHG